MDLNNYDHPRDYPDETPLRDLPTRAGNVLKAEGFFCFGEVRSKPDDYFLRIEGVGNGVLKEIREWTGPYNPEASVAVAKLTLAELAKTKEELSHIRGSLNLIGDALLRIEQRIKWTTPDNR